MEFDSSIEEFDPVPNSILQRISKASDGYAVLRFQWVDDLDIQSIFCFCVSLKTRRAKAKSPSPFSTA
jgi:hypothetical protein